jgi:uncharacterized protein
MSPGPADQVNAKELAARAAVVERRLDLARLPRVQEAGGLPGTCVDAQLRFGTFEGRTTVDVAIEGIVALRCQRCLQPCECAVDESAQLMVVRDEDEELPGGYEPVVGSPDHLSLVAVIEEQVLLALPLVPLHEAGTPGCLPVGDDAVSLAPPPDMELDTAQGAAAREERQTPFANLRELLKGDNERDPRTGE